MNALLPIAQPPILATVIRALATRIIAEERKADPGPMAKLLYPNSPEVVLATINLRSYYKSAVQKATTPPARTDAAGWAAELAVAGSAGIVAGLSAPISAYSQLAARGIALSFAGVNSVVIPGRDPKAIPNFFVGEGAPIPVVALTFAQHAAKVYKGGVISYYSGILAKYSAPDIEQVLRSQLAVDASLAIDAVLVSASAATASSPAGLRNGIAETPHATGGTPEANFAADLGNLAAAISIPLDLAYIVSTTDYAKALAYAPGLADRLIASAALPAKMMLAADCAYFYSVEDPLTFDISTSHEVTLVTADPATPIVEGAGVLGKPVQSALQANLIAIRLLADVAFGLARPNRASWTSGVEW